MKLNMRDMSECKALCQGKACLRSSLSSYQIVDLVVMLLEKWFCFTSIRPKSDLIIRARRYYFPINNMGTITIQLRLATYIVHSTDHA